MHDWNLTKEEARFLQEELAEDCILEGKPEVELVAGLDVSFYPGSQICIASAVSYSLKNQHVCEEVLIISKLEFPYISGLLAFREAPPMIEAALSLKNKPDCFIVDGHGYAHPRRMGLASHIGLFLDTPTIGCAKNILVGEYNDPGPEVGDSDVIWDGEPIGHVIRSRKEAKPIFISPGHMIDPEYLPQLVKPFLTGDYRLPEPLRQAEIKARSERQLIEQIIKPFVDHEISICFVGGTLRDLLTGKKPRDYDLMVGEFSREVRRDLENQFGGHWFALDPDRQMYRLPGKKIQLDLMVVPPEEVEDDLERRDFTINSVALDMGQDLWVDPFGGREDASKRVLCPTTNSSLADDPLRLLRGYRLAAEHHLSFHPQLRERISETVPLLGRVSKERITEELLKLCGRQDASHWFEVMYDDGVMTEADFLRSEVVEESRIIERWKPTIKNYPLIKEREYHGGYDLLTCFKMARAIRQSELDDWPLHQQIKRLCRESFLGFSTRPTDLKILSANSLALLGRVLGQGLTENWGGPKIINKIVELEEYLELRGEKTKQIVEEHKNEDNLGEIKNEQLQQVLPELWSNTIGGN